MACWQGLEGREAVTVVVDDSHSVWAAHRRNLVMVERYVFFPSSRKQLGLMRLSLWESSRLGGAAGYTASPAVCFFTAAAAAASFT